MTLSMNRSHMVRAALPLLLLPFAGAVQRHRVAKCVVFHSQHKSGGATIEGKLSRYPLKSSGVEIGKWMDCPHCKLHCDQENWDCEKQTCPQTEELFTPLSTLKIAYKGYTPLLAGSKEWGSAGSGKCVWATISREPVSRLVSAYYYCRLVWDNDPLCGSGAIDFSKATLHEFAQHWGNFLFREFLWFPQFRALAESRKDFRHDILPSDMCNGNRTTRTRWKDPWVGYKDQLNGGDDPRTKSGKLNFQAVKTGLRKGQLYDVYGVLERYNETMALFDEHLPFEGTTWMIENLVHGMHADHGSQGADGWKADEERDLADARMDPVILAELSGDIELYNAVILPMFEEKTLHLQNSLEQTMQDAIDKVGWEYADEAGILGKSSEEDRIRRQLAPDY